MVFLNSSLPKMKPTKNWFLCKCPSCADENKWYLDAKNTKQPFPKCGKVFTLIEQPSVMEMQSQIKEL